MVSPCRCRWRREGTWFRSSPRGNALRVEFRDGGGLVARRGESVVHDEGAGRPPPLPKGLGFSRGVGGPPPGPGPARGARASLGDCCGSNASGVGAGMPGGGAGCVGARGRRGPDRGGRAEAPFGVSGGGGDGRAGQGESGGMALSARTAVTGGSPARTERRRGGAPAPPTTHWDFSLYRSP